MAGNRKRTGQTPRFGNQRSHSMIATRRKWNLNLQNKRFFVPELGGSVRVQVTAAEMKTIDKIGLPAFLRQRGLSLADLN
ncbi:MAG: 50S ribosomal protein L28 [bacterium]|nr:50S ribosomal protein L28 [bacterium]